VRDTLSQTEIRAQSEEHSRKVIIHQKDPTTHQRGQADHQRDPTTHQKGQADHLRDPTTHQGDPTTHLTGPTTGVGGITNREMLMGTLKRDRKNAAREWGSAMHHNGGAQVVIMAIAAGVISLKTEWISQLSEVKISKRKNRSNRSSTKKMLIPTHLYV
jgi:hypothetical protein